MTAIPILLSWSGGKDCLMALESLRADPVWQVVGLLTTVTEQYENRISMHGIENAVLQAQAKALQLPLIEAVLQAPTDGAAYENAHEKALQQAGARWPGLHHCAFGDLFLQDVRDYRENQLAKAGWKAVFPLWHTPTQKAAQHFIASGHRAVLVCVDTTQLAAKFCGREFDSDLLKALPDDIDPCGEHGEFHTLSYGGPLFNHGLALQRGAALLRDERFQYTDFHLARVPDNTRAPV